jgi:hypothetical protein
MTDTNPRLAHALTVMAYQAAKGAEIVPRYRQVHNDRGMRIAVTENIDNTAEEAAIAFARAADEADGLVSP